jgi:hypothetical protein
LRLREAVEGHEKPGAGNLRRAVNKTKKDKYNSIRRHNEALSYLLHNGTFPKPIIAMAAASGLNVLDGSHRVTGLCITSSSR